MRLIAGEGEQQIAALSSPAHPSPLQALAPFALWPRFAWQGRDASPQAYRSGPPEEEPHRPPIIKRRRQAGESREEDVARDESAELSLALEAVPEADDPSPLMLYPVSECYRAPLKRPRRAPCPAPGHSDSRMDGEAKSFCFFHIQCLCLNVIPVGGLC